jgi:phosphate transport system substrate-binding protein
MLMKNSGLRLIVFSMAVLMAFGACKQKPKKTATEDEESYSKGSAKFVVDDSFAPIVGEEEFVFKSLYPEAKPEMLYRSENQALNMFLNDSVRVAILSRELKPEEAKIMVSRTLPPETIPFAIDAIALIVHKSSRDTLITVAEIKKMLNGQTKTDRNIVFDNPNSSLVRYLKEFSGNNELKQKNVYALKSNKEVIKYVSEHPNAIGITGFSWLNDPDADYATAVSQVKTIAVKDEQSKKYSNEYFKPSQSTLALKQYPLSRTLYIINCTGKGGIGTGFAWFLASERGQRIILRSGLLPDSIPPREININNN